MLINSRILLRGNGPEKLWHVTFMVPLRVYIWHKFPKVLFHPELSGDFPGMTTWRENEVERKERERDGGKARGSGPDIRRWKCTQETTQSSSWGKRPFYHVKKEAQPVPTLISGNRKEAGEGRKSRGHKNIQWGAIQFHMHERRSCLGLRKNNRKKSIFIQSEWGCLSLTSCRFYAW